MNRTHILILAAGASSRMAPLDKLTETLAGQPLLRRTTAMALATGAPVTLVLPPDRPERAEVVRGLVIRTVIANDAALGMSASLKTGLADLPEGVDAVMILPADMAALTTGDLSLMLRAAKDFPGHILRGATEDGREGHPVVFPAFLIPALTALCGDEGGRVLVKAHRPLVRRITLPGDNALLDLDTPEDWAAYRALSGQ
jgi:molybdenum cofactor cytidylyltransferase